MSQLHLTSNSAHKLRTNSKSVQSIGAHKYRSPETHAPNYCSYTTLYTLFGKILTYSEELKQVTNVNKELYEIQIYRVSQEERTKLRESVPYVQLYRYNPKHLYPKFNGYGDNGHRKVSTYCKPSVTPYSSSAHARQPDTAS